MMVENQVVANVEAFTGTAKTGKVFTKYTLIMSDGTKYACNFDKPSCNSGDTVSFMTTPPNAYSNGARLAVVKSLTVTAKGAGPVAAPTATSKATKQGGGFNNVFPVPQDHDRMATLRMNALTNAVTFVTSFQEDYAADEDAVINVAYAFTDFLSGAMDAKILAEADKKDV